MFGNDFNKPIRDSIPPGFNTALKIVKWAIDPALDGDPYADKPYLYSPGLATWNYFRIGETVDLNRLLNSSEANGNETNQEKKLHDSIDVVEEGADGSGQDERDGLKIPNEPSQRKKHFLDENTRQEFIFKRGRQYFVDFGNPYLGFSGIFFFACAFTPSQLL